MIVADLRILAFGEGTSQDRPVEQALAELERQDVRYEVGPLGTTIEAESLEKVLDAVRAVHERVRQTTGRVFTQLSIDERLDKEETADTLKLVEPAREVGR